jgi:hypothetical protein
MNEGQISIDSLLGEHAALRAHLNLVRGLTREWKLLLDQKISILQSPDKLEFITVKRANLRQAMGYLDDGLKQHHNHEDLVFAPLIGNPLMESIKLEHVEMLKLLENVNNSIINDNIERFLSKGLQIMQTIDEICDLSGSHSSREDGILHFLKKLPVQSV